MFNKSNSFTEIILFGKREMLHNKRLMIQTDSSSYKKTSAIFLTFRQRVPKPHLQRLICNFLEDGRFLSGSFIILWLIGGATQPATARGRAMASTSSGFGPVWGKVADKEGGSHGY